MSNVIVTCGECEHEYQTSYGWTFSCPHCAYLDAFNSEETPTSSEEQEERKND